MDNRGLSQLSKEELIDMISDAGNQIRVTNDEIVALREKVRGLEQRIADSYTFLVRRLYDAGMIDDRELEWL